MDFCKFVISFILGSTIADFSYLKLDFFQYEFFLHNEFQWLSIFKFIIEILLFALLLFGVYNLLEFLKKWRMKRRYIKAQKERNEEME